MFSHSRTWSPQRATIAVLVTVVMIVMLFRAVSTNTSDNDSENGSSLVSFSTSENVIVHSLHKRIQTLQQQLQEKDHQQQQLVDKVDTIMNQMGTIMEKWIAKRGGQITETEQQLLNILKDHSSDTPIAGSHEHETEHEHENDNAVVVASHEGHDHPGIDTSAIPHEHRLTAAEQKNVTACHKLRTDYQVQMGRDWGNLPKSHQAIWASLGCDTLLAKADRYEREKWRQLSLTRTHPIHKPTPPSTELPVIALCVCSTTRTVWDLKSLDDLTLFSNLLPSFVKTVEPGFEYFVYITYDQGDLFYDVDGMHDKIEQWFEVNVRGPLRKRGIESRVYVLMFDNREHKPGPAFNFVLSTAYKDAVTYFYRVNDDTVLETPWANKFTNALRSLGEPYGVVGPDCKMGNTHILTHDFTHRTHLDMFPTYYPPSLSDWWMDDWISKIYGRRRTIKVNSVTVGHSGHHGTRYEINHEHRGMLATEIEQGKEYIVRYMRNKKMSENIVNSYITDIFQFDP